MKIKDLSFITEIDQEKTNNVNGGFDPFADVGNNPIMDQGLAIQQQVFDIYMALSLH